MDEDGPTSQLSNPELVTLTKNLIDHAREEARVSGANDGPAKKLQPGATIDFGHRNIQELPNEVIELMKDEIERLALAHNQLTSFPLSLSSCSRLRYLNVRYNAFKDFPEPILQLSSLEILDISKNRLRALPENLNNLTSLKVLAVQRNRIEKLPVCLGDISSLQVLKLDGNPLMFPPTEICSLRKDSLAPSNDNERDRLITMQVKRYLKQIQTRERLKIDSEGESSEGNLDTPRPRRAISGRFPVRPSLNGSESSSDNKTDSAVDNSATIKSHLRGTSQNNYVTRRPSLAPILNNNNSVNERNRSNSESLMPRSKRMGIVSRKNQSNMEDESRIRRLSHYRGFSQGSILSSSALTNGTTSSSPASIGDKEYYDKTKRPLSDLSEERKRKSRATDVLVEASKSILYAMIQVHEPVTSLLGSIRRSKVGRSERNELERRLGVTRIQLEELSRQIRLYDSFVEEEEEEHDYYPSAEDIKIMCSTCVEHYMNICLVLYEYVSEAVVDVDTRSIRTLLLLLYGSTNELRNSCTIIGADLMDSSPPFKFPARPVTAERVVTPTQNRISIGQQRSISSSRGNIDLNTPESSSIQSTIVNTNDISRTSTMTSLGMATTPRSVDSFPSFSSAISQSSTMQGVEDPEEERLFERIYLKLASACRMINDAMPGCRSAFTRIKGLTRVGSDARRDNLYNGALLIDLCDAIIDAARGLNRRLSGIKLKDPIIRTQTDFWQLCRSLMESWSDLAVHVREIAQFGFVTEEIKLTMKPIQKAIKEISQLINASPWSSLAVRSPVAAVPTPPSITDFPLSSPPTYSALTTRHNPLPSLQQIPHTINTSISPSHPSATTIHTSATSGIASNSASSISSAHTYLTSVPPTPLSAALGPAAQATVPISAITSPANGPLPPNTLTFPSHQNYQTGPTSGGRSQPIFQQNLDLQIYPPANQGLAASSGPQTGVFAGNVFERAERLLASQQGGRSRV